MGQNRRRDMHLYLWDPTRLAGMLPQFIGGQCQIHARDLVVYRGKVKEIITYPHKHKICIIFEWLCERGQTKNEFDQKEVTWFMVPAPPSGEPSMEFHYVTYYFQKKHDRLKLKGWKESCRFYSIGDTTNLGLGEIRETR